MGNGRWLGGGESGSGMCNAPALQIYGERHQGNMSATYEALAAVSMSVLMAMRGDQQRTSIRSEQVVIGF